MRISPLQSKIIAIRKKQFVELQKIFQRKKGARKNILSKKSYGQKSEHVGRYKKTRGAFWVFLHPKISPQIMRIGALWSMRDFLLHFY